MPRRFVNYLSVSTNRQGRSSLGFEAQHAAVAAHLAGSTRARLDEVVTFESGTAMAFSRSSHMRWRYAS